MVLTNMLRRVLLLALLLAIALASPAPAQFPGSGIIGGRPHNWLFPEDPATVQFYRNFPTTANLATVFDVSASGTYVALSAPGATQKMYWDVDPGANATRAITAPNEKLAFYAFILPNSAYPPADSEYLEMRCLTSAGVPVISARVTYHGLASSDGYADIHLYTDTDATGFTAEDIRVKASGVYIGIYIEVHADTDGTANLVLSHRTLTDYSDGVRAKDGYYWAESVPYSGVIGRAQFLVPNQGIAAIDCHSFSIGENPWYVIGDSNGEQLRKCFAVSSATVNGSHTDIPVIGHSTPGGTGVSLTTTVLAAITTDQHAERVILGPLGTNDYGTTGYANQSALETALADALEALHDAGTRVAVCTIPPRGSTSYPATARNEATTAAVLHTNALLRSLAESYGFGLIDLHEILGDGVDGSDLFADALTSDGVHIKDFIGFEYVADGIVDHNLYPFPE